METKNVNINKLIKALDQACKSTTSADKSIANVTFYHTSDRYPWINTKEHQNLVATLGIVIEDPIALTVLHKLVNYLKYGRSAGPVIMPKPEIII
jgi:hypothetical protein